MHTNNWKRENANTFSQQYNKKEYFSNQSTFFNNANAPKTLEEFKQQEKQYQGMLDFGRFLTEYLAATKKDNKEEKKGSEIKKEEKKTNLSFKNDSNRKGEGWKEKNKVRNRKITDNSRSGFWLVIFLRRRYIV